MHYFEAGGTTITPTRTWVMSARGGAPIQMALCQKVGNLRKMKCCGFDSDPQEMTDPAISFVPMIFGIPGHGIHGNDTSPDPDPRYKVDLI